MTACYAYPQAARFGRVLSKSKIYGAARVPKKLRQCFVDQVEQIVWACKLAPETINLNAAPDVPEIQVFELRLKEAELDYEVLRAIDKAINFPLLFELAKHGKRRMIAAYKRRSEANSAKRVISEYFAADWEAADAPRKPLPQALHLGVLYDKILFELLPGQPRKGEALIDRVARIEAIRAKQREIERIKARLTREPQFNKQVAINAELRAATAELNQLSRRQSAAGV